MLWNKLYVEVEKFQEEWDYLLWCSYFFWDFPGKICSSYKHSFDENSVSSVAISNICDSETEKSHVLNITLMTRSCCHLLSLSWSE